MSYLLYPHSIAVITLGFAVVMGVSVGMSVDGPGHLDEAYNETGDQVMENVSDDLEGNASDTTISVVTTAGEAMIDGSKGVAYGVAWYLEAVQTPAGKAVYAATVLPSVGWIGRELF